MRFTAPLKVLGLTLMLMWIVAAIFDIGPVLIRPLFLLLGAFLSWWVVRASEN